MVTFIITKLINTTIEEEEILLVHKQIRHNNHNPNPNKMKILALISGGKDSIFNIAKCI